MPLLAYGLNHKTAPLSIREKVAITDNIHQEFLQSFKMQTPIDEAAVISTCNRTEWYCSTQSHEQVIEWLADYHALPSKTLQHYCYAYHDSEAVRHLLRVACGLDSMVLGEPQILGQVKTAYQQARSGGTLGVQLEHLFQHTFSASKKIRSNTALGVNPVSVAYAAVNLVNKIYSDLSSLTVMLIGAGETTQLCARYLQQYGTRKFIIANRNQQRAQSFVERFHGEFCPIVMIPEKLNEVDIVISATASPLPILGKGLVERILKQRKSRPILLVDLAVPRDIEPEVNQLANVFLYNIDDLKSLVDQGINERKDAAKKAEQIIEVEVNHFLRWQRSLKAVDTIRDYRDKMQHVGDNEYQQALDALQRGVAPEDVLKNFSHRLLHKIMHQPSVRLRKAGYDGRDDVLELAKYLFVEES